MSHTPTPEERAIIVDVASDVLRAVIERLTPDLAKLAEALRERPAVFLEPRMSGTLEALPVFQPRDYRKEAYIAGWSGARAANGDAFQCREAARAAVAHFDEDWAAK